MAIIKLFGGNFAPKGWAFCDGALLSVNQHQALYSLIGTYYGGDGVTTFALPDLRSRVPVHVGGSPAPDLPSVQLGERKGAPTVTLTRAQMPNHTHPLMVNSAPATAESPVNGVLALGNFSDSASGNITNVSNFAAMPNDLASSMAIGNVGESQPISLMQPYLGLNYIICLEGIYPPRP